MYCRREINSTIYLYMYLWCNFLFHLRYVNWKTFGSWCKKIPCVCHIVVCSFICESVIYPGPCKVMTFTKFKDQKMIVIKAQLWKNDLAFKKKNRLSLKIGIQNHHVLGRYVIKFSEKILIIMEIIEVLVSGAFLFNHPGIAKNSHKFKK